MKGTARKGAHCACSHSLPKFQHQEIHIVVHTNSPKNGQLYDWMALDLVFTLSDNSWPALRVVDISICAEFDFEYSETLFLINFCL